MILHNVLMVKVNQNYKPNERNLYEATRHAWPVRKDRAEKLDYVLAVYYGKIVGAFRATRWTIIDDGDCEFDGVRAHPNVWNHYLDLDSPRGTWTIKYLDNIR